MTELLNIVNLSLEKRYITDFPAEVAIYLGRQAPQISATILSKHQVPLYVRVFDFLPSSISCDILECLPSHITTEIITLLDTAKAAQVLSGMRSEEVSVILSNIDAATASILQEMMHYPDNTAGKSMDMRFLSFTEDMTVGQAINKLKNFARIKYRVIFLVDLHGVLQKYINIQDLLFADKSTRLSNLAKEIRASVLDVDRLESVMESIEQAKVTDLPVVNYEGKLVGVIRYSELIQHIQERAVSGLQTLVGVSKDERALSTIFDSVRKRLPWLQINLLTAFLAASVVGVFESTISQFTALAVLLPVVAGQSGNTGAQALAVTMRGIFLREFQYQQWWRVILKEMGAGFINGVAIALTTALGVYLWSSSSGLSLVLFLSMITSMVIAGVAGAAIPIIMSRLGMDPASSSSIILTTVTDVFGFLSFLGIATLLMSLL